MTRLVLLGFLLMALPAHAGMDVFDPGPSSSSATVPVTAGGTGLSTLPTSGQLLIGNAANGYTLNALTGTASQVTVTNGSGSITLSLPATINVDTSGNAATATTATTSTNATTADALSANPTDCGAGTKATAIAANGNLTCSAVSLTADVSGTLPVGNGGTGATTLTSGSFLLGDGTNPVTFQAAGLTQTISVRKGDDSGACDLGVTKGLITSTTC